ncbi:uncharacterized protein [Anabrus simplex]|uniref:uncharacterized protein n=1 Tax=Anabrus simplex TaxID=316456 RepID=UPI0035A3C6B9
MIENFCLNECVSRLLVTEARVKFHTPRHKMLLSKSFLVLLLVTLVVSQEITPAGILREKWEAVRTRIRNIIRNIRTKAMEFRNHIRQHVKNIREIIENKIEASTRKLTGLTEELKANASALGVDINSCLSIQNDLKADLQEGTHRCVEDQVLSARNVSGTFKALLHDASEILHSALEGLQECKWRPLCATRKILKVSIHSLRLARRLARISVRAIKFVLSFLPSTNKCVDKELTNARSEVSSAMDDISSCAEKQMRIFR